MKIMQIFFRLFRKITSTSNFIQLNVMSIVAFIAFVFFSGDIQASSEKSTHLEFRGDDLTVINYSNKPVYGMALKIDRREIALENGQDLKKPIELVRADGVVVPLFKKGDGEEELRTLLSLKGHERMDFKIREAKSWGEIKTTATYDAATQMAQLSNGFITLVYAKEKWSLAYAANPSATICQENRLEYWLSDKRHGRLMGMSDEKLRGMELLRSTESATIVDGKATVHPDRSVSLVLRKIFPGIGKNVIWEESYTLNANEPILTYKTRWSCVDDLTRYIAYVELGGGLKGEFGPLLQGKLRFKYDIPSSGSEETASGISVAHTNDLSSEGPRILLSGKNNSFTRISWRNERCWAGVDSELGNGLAFSTFKDAYGRFIPGNTVWALDNGGYRIRLLDDTQENQPYEFSKAKPLELGFAIAATCADVGIWNQGRLLFKAVTKGQAPSIGDACGVYVNEKPIKQGETLRIDYNQKSNPFILAGKTLTAFVETDFKRPYSLTAKVSGATEQAPIRITATAKDGQSFDLLKISKPGEQTVDFTAATNWLLSRRIYTLNVHQEGKARLEALTLAPSKFTGPQLDVPANKLSITDIATFYRWQQIKGAIDYEIQLSRSVNFDSPISLQVRSEVVKPYYMPSDNELPASGKWYWRVRALEEESAGLWSEVRTFTVNKDIAKKPLVFKPTPEHPIFTMEGCRVSDWGRFKNTIPEDIKPYVVFNTGVYKTDDYISYFKPIEEMKIRALLRTHAPAPMSQWAPLSMVEAIFQRYPNVIGISAGETLSAHYHGGENRVYTERLLKLCGKYGRIFYDADGSYPSENKFQALYDVKGEFMEEYKNYLIFAQKNNILHRQFVSQSSVLGLYLDGDIAAQGAWEDGGWYWQQVGFRKLGEIKGQRGGDVTDMPRIFWTLNYAMGLGRGCSVFSFEGQVGTTPVPEGWNVARQGLPEITDAAYRNPAAFWTTEGELLPTFSRYCLPFIRGVINHKLVPTKDEVRQNIKLAIYNDGVVKKDDGDQYYYEWESVYRGTYGFRDIGVHPGTLMEYFPNTGRYNYFPVLPQGKRNLGKGINVLPLSQLGETEKVRSVFNAAYPEWYSGDALVNIVGDTLTVLNSNENLDETQTYSVPLKNRSAFTNIEGKIGPHAYVLGKFHDSNKRLWLQANTEYSERDTELTLTCKGDPQIKITPAAAVKVNHLDAASGKLILRLSHAEGAVEVELMLAQ